MFFFFPLITTRVTLSLSLSHSKNHLQQQQRRRRRRRGGGFLRRRDRGLTTTVLASSSQIRHRYNIYIIYLCIYGDGDSFIIERSRIGTSLSDDDRSYRAGAVRSGSGKDERYCLLPARFIFRQCVTCEHAIIQ